MTPVWATTLAATLFVAPLAVAGWLILRVLRRTARGKITADRRGYLLGRERQGQLTGAEFDEWWADNNRWAWLIQGATIFVMILLLAGAIAAVRSVAKDLPTPDVIIVIGIGALLIVAAFWIVRIAIALIRDTRGLLLVVALFIWGAFAVGWAPVGWILVGATGVVIGGMMKAAMGPSPNAITPGRILYEQRQREYWKSVERGSPRHAGNEEPWSKIGRASRGGWESIAQKFLQS